MSLQRHHHQLGELRRDQHATHLARLRLCLTENVWHLDSEYDSLLNDNLIVP